MAVYRQSELAARASHPCFDPLRSQLVTRYRHPRYDVGALRTSAQFRLGIPGRGVGLLAVAARQHGNGVTELRSTDHAGPGALLRKLSSKSELVMNAVTAKHNASLGAALCFFELASFFYALVKESTKVSVNTGTFKLLLRLALCVPVIAN